MMTRTLTAILVLVFFSLSGHAQNSISLNLEMQGHYAKINGLNMYYEIHGTGKPLVLLHGATSTIASDFGHVLDSFARHHEVIAVELQAHGHTHDINRPLSFEQDADDVAALLERLNIAKADFLGFSNGATTVLQLAIRHTALVDHIVLCSGIYSRSGMPPAFWNDLRKASFDSFPQAGRDDYLRANPDPKALHIMFNKCIQRMQNFKDIPVTDMKNIRSPALIINGDKETVRADHALEMSQLIPHARLAILTAGHGDYLGTRQRTAGKITPLVTAMIEEFLTAR
ncbi:MAG TPA: alpha/beta fold hydrolase [Chitinophaga sp.]|uniref:alpha/beta fold hydrolase n=1 Tax=Chitinophaga sp. TaxID=1869181 RepID=UPI002CE94D33|nr:alpha/beta fold hydrolase [Chitinophaga sp.]HVI47195.1 alpha/beta fold hydrolase [Chitinophaga sp.]